MAPFPELIKLNYYLATSNLVRYLDVYGTLYFRVGTHLCSDEIQLLIIHQSFTRPQACVVGVTKRENIVPRVGLEPTSLAFQASVLPIHHVGFLMSSLYQRRPVCEAPCLRGQFRLLQSSSWNCKSFNAYNSIHTYIHWSYTYIHGIGSTTIQHVACTASWSWKQCHCCDENGKYCTQSGTQTHISGILDQCVTITPCRLPDVITIPTPTNVCSSLPQRSVQTTTPVSHSTSYSQVITQE